MGGGGGGGGLRGEGGVPTKFYCLLEFHFYIDFIDFTLEKATGNC